MGSLRVPHTRIIALLLMGIAACSSGGSGTSCGSCLAPIPFPDGGSGIANYEGPKTNNAVSAKISQQGFDYINGHWRTLLTSLIPGVTVNGSGNPVINIPVPCTVVAVNTVGIDNANICDTNFSDGCNAGEACNNINVTISNFALNPQESTGTNTAQITGVATLAVNTGNIPVSTSNTIAECAFLEHFESNVSFNNSGDPISLTVPLTLSLDGRIDPDHPLLTFSVGTINGLQNLNSNDLNLDGNNTCGSIYSDLIDALTGTILNFIIQQLQPTIQSKIQSIVDGEKCRTCGEGDAVCPSGDNGGKNSSCSSGTCMISGDANCVPRLLGLEGLIMPGTLLGNYGVPPSAALAISAAAGGSVSSADSTAPNAGLSLGVIGGAQSYTGTPPAYLAPCVPDLPAPSGTAPSAPDFDADAPDGGYHVGLGVSDLFLNQALYAAHRSGTLCLAISGEQVGLLNSGLFKTFLPSVGLLAGNDTLNAPMMVALRPLQTPTIDIGEGTYDPVTLKPIDPLITLTLNDVVIDIYALIEDRWSRLFTLTLNVQLPLSLIVDGCPQGITPALGDLSNLITVSQAPTNSELLAEDPSVLQGLIPAVVSLAGPALASALKPIAVPTVDGFAVHIDGLEGIGNRGSTSFDDLGLFGNLELAGQCDAASVRTRAQLVGSFIPTPEQLHPAAGQKLPWPSATIAVSATGYDGDVEYDYRVDQGLWTTFKPGPTLTVSDPRFLFQGHHNIDVRGRPAHGRGVADPSPVQVDFLVDWEAPSVKIRQDASGFHVTALDNVTGPQSLTYRYAVGSEPLSDWGPARAIDAQAIVEVGKLVVQVQDQAGNIGSASWHGVTTVATSGIIPPSGGESKPGHEAGCGTVGSGGFSVAALLTLGLALRFRRRR